MRCNTEVPWASRTWTALHHPPTPLPINTTCTFKSTQTHMLSCTICVHAHTITWCMTTRVAAMGTSTEGAGWMRGVGEVVRANSTACTAARC